ncbi:MAG: chemotaxis protein CheW [Methanoregulaceae archaeon]
METNVQERQGCLTPAGRGWDRNEPIQVVEFILGDELFAISLFDVKEVVEYREITRLPDVSPRVKGIIDLRGEITTIIDIRQRLGVPPRTAPEESSRIIVIDDTKTRSRMAILVDDVRAVSTFDAARVDPASALVTKDDAAVVGIIKRKIKLKDREQNELIIWIDITQLLPDSDKEPGA